MKDYWLIALLPSIIIVTLYFGLTNIMIDNDKLRQTKQADTSLIKEVYQHNNVISPQSPIHGDAEAQRLLDSLQLHGGDSITNVAY
jgi:hypothetical protein